MKKYVVSAVFIGAFIAYAFVLKSQNSSENTTVPPSQLTLGGSTTTGGTSASLETLNPQSSGTSNQGSGTTSSGQSTAKFKDGSYIGTSADSFYGTVQVKAIVQNGKLADVQFLKYPNDRGTSIQISNESLPKLKAEAIQKQSAQVDAVSGATDTSHAFSVSLASALSQASNQTVQ